MSEWRRAEERHGFHARRVRVAGLDKLHRTPGEVSRGELAAAWGGALLLSAAAGVTWLVLRKREAVAIDVPADGHYLHGVDAVSAK